jgi:hypothetical protein
MYATIDKKTETKGKPFLPEVTTASQEITVDTLSALNIYPVFNQEVLYVSQPLHSIFLSIGFNPLSWHILPYPTSHMTFYSLVGTSLEWNFEVKQDFEDLYEAVLNERYIKKYIEKNINLDIKEKPEEYFETLLAVKYRYIPEVKAIYIDEYLEEKNITILVSINQYDDKLMEILIQKELDISKIFPDIIANYNYIPDLIEDRKSIIGEKTKLIFER